MTCWLTPQMTITTSAEPDQNLEPRIPSGSSMRVAGAPTLGSPSVAFPDIFTGSGVGSGGARTCGMRIVAGGLASGPAERPVT